MGACSAVEGERVLGHSARVSGQSCHPKSDTPADHRCKAASKTDQKFVLLTALRGKGGATSI